MGIAKVRSALRERAAWFVSAAAIALGVACGGSSGGRRLEQHSSRLSERTELCELEGLSEATLWARGRFPYASVSAEGRATLLSSSTGEMSLVTRVDDGGWHLRGEVDPSVHTVLRTRRDVRINPVVEVLLGTTALVQSRKGELFLSQPESRVDDARMRLLSGREARVRCADLTLTRWIRAEPAWRASAELHQERPVYVRDKPSGKVAATLFEQERRLRIRTYQRVGDFVRIAYRTDGLLLRGWVRSVDVSASGSPPPIYRYSLHGTVRHSHPACWSPVSLPVYAVTLHSREVVGYVSPGTQLMVFGVYDEELSIRPRSIDLRMHDDVDLRVRGSMADLHCLP